MRILVVSDLHYRLPHFDWLVKAAQDVDVVAMSILSGAHNHLFPRVTELLAAKGVDDVLVVGGGVIPEDDYEFLKSKGVAAIFGPGTPTKTTIDFIRANLKRK